MLFSRANKTVLPFKVVRSSIYSDLASRVEEMEKVIKESASMSVRHANAFAENERLLKEKEELQKTVDILTADAAARDKMREVIDVFMADPSPVDSAKRRSYVAQVAGLHKNILEPKLKFIISNSLKVLEDGTNSREDDIALKGAIYALRELILWGNSMVNEQLAYQTDKEDK